MSILKIVQETHDFDHTSALSTTSATYVDTSRVDFGRYFSNNGQQSASATWPAPAGNDLWVHWRGGQSSTTSQWDDRDLMRFYDSNLNSFMNMGVENGTLIFEIYGDTTSVTTAPTDTSAHVYDIHMQKNGTTSITFTLYRDSVLHEGPISVTNTADIDLPTRWIGRGIDDNGAGTWYFSELIIADEDTRGWRLRMHDVTSFGAVSDWTGDANTVALDTLETSLRSNTLDQRAAFGLNRLENIPSGAVIDRVVIQSYAQRGATGLASFNHFFRWEDTTIVDDADIALSVNGGVYVEEYPTSPDTTLAWTDVEMQGLQFGVRART